MASNNINPTGNFSPNLNANTPGTPSPGSLSTPAWGVPLMGNPVGLEYSAQLSNGVMSPFSQSPSLGVGGDYLMGLSGGMNGILSQIFGPPVLPGQVVQGQVPQQVPVNETVNNPNALPVEQVDEEMLPPEEQLPEETQQVPGA
jgi:hypothetical protein